MQILKNEKCKYKDQKDISKCKKEAYSEPKNEIHNIQSEKSRRGYDIKKIHFDTAKLLSHKKQERAEVRARDKLKL